MSPPYKATLPPPQTPHEGASSFPPAHAKNHISHHSASSALRKHHPYPPTPQVHPPSSFRFPKAQRHPHSPQQAIAAHAHHNPVQSHVSHAAHHHPAHSRGRSPFRHSHPSGSLLYVRSRWPPDGSHSQHHSPPVHIAHPHVHHWPASIRPHSLPP